MSDDLIRRSDAIDAIHSYWKGEINKLPVTDSEYGEVIDGDYATLLKHNKELSTRIKDLSSADRPQGTWIYVTVEEWLRTGRDYGHHCSECDEINKSGKSNFCPNCGSRNRKENE